MNNLKYCPFCGGDAELTPADMTQFSHKGGEQYYYAGCKAGCAAFLGETKAKASIRWNERAYVGQRLAIVGEKAFDIKEIIESISKPDFELEGQLNE